MCTWCPRQSINGQVKTLSHRNILRTKERHFLMLIEIIQQDDAQIPKLYTDSPHFT